MAYILLNYHPTKGESDRKIRKILREHKYAFRNQMVERSRIVDHRLSCQSSCLPHSENTQITLREVNPYKRKTKVSRLGETMPTQCGAPKAFRYALCGTVHSVVEPGAIQTDNVAAQRRPVPRESCNKNTVHYSRGNHVIHKYFHNKLDKRYKAVTFSS